MLEKRKGAAHDAGAHFDDTMARIVMDDAAGKLGFEIEWEYTRDPKVLSTKDIVIDVGNEFRVPSPQDIQTLRNIRLDHHQRGFNEKNARGIKMSALGLVLTYFGDIATGDSEVTGLLWEAFGYAADAADNGVKLVADNAYLYGDVAPTTIQSFFSSLWPSWNESDQDWDKARGVALGVGRLIWENALKMAKGQKKAWDLVREIADDTLGPIVVLDRFLPAVRILSQEYPDKLYFVYPDERDGTWKAQAIPIHPKSFTSRMPFPETWRGQTKDNLHSISGLSLNFCHSSGFLLGAEDKDSVIAACEVAAVS